MDVKDLQDKAEEATIDLVGSITRKLLWTCGLTARLPEVIDDRDLYNAQREWLIGRLVLAIAGFCKKAGIDLESCLVRAEGPEPYAEAPIKKEETADVRGHG